MTGGPALHSIEIPDRVRARTGFPYDVPTIRTLERLELTAPVTILVGENGSGKSTLLEALAIATRLPTVGRTAAVRDPTLKPQRELAKGLRLSWRGRRTHRGFFLRAEDFFGFAKRLREQKAEHEAELARIAVEFADASDYARRLAEGPHRASIGAMHANYGEDLDAQSHGESFLALLRARLNPGGLYILDEPEAALSPQSQLGFIAMCKAALDDGAQFLMATHAPILMAIPGAQIVTFDESPPRTIPFDELDHVNLVRNFLAEPQRYLRHIWV